MAEQYCTNFFEKIKEIGKNAQIVVDNTIKKHYNKIEHYISCGSDFRRLFYKNRYSPSHHITHDMRKTLEE